MHLYKDLDFTTDSNSNYNMCGILIINCIEHGCELARETGLCDKGKNGLICMNTAKFTNAFKSGHTPYVMTSSGHQLVAENMMSINYRKLRHELVAKFGIEKERATEMDIDYYKMLNAKVGMNNKHRKPSEYDETVESMASTRISSRSQPRGSVASSSRSRTASKTSSRTSSWSESLGGFENEASSSYSTQNRVVDVTDDVHEVETLVPDDSVSSCQSKVPTRSGSVHSNKSGSTIRGSSRTSRTPKVTTEYYSREGKRLMPVNE